MNIEIDPAVLCGMINAPIDEAKVAVETLHMLIKDLPKKRDTLAIKAQIGDAQWSLVRKGDTWVVGARVLENPSDL